MALTKNELKKCIKDSADWDELDELKDAVDLYLMRNKKSDIYEFSAEIHRILKKDSVKLAEWEKLPKQAVKLDTSIDFYNEYADDLKTKFVKAYNSNSTTYYKIEDEHQQIVSEFPTEKEYVSGIKSYLQADLVHNKSYPVTQKQLSEFSSFWRHENSHDLKKPPELFKLPDEKGWTKEVGGCLPAEEFTGFPTWEGVLERLSEPEVFAAWVYGIYTQKYEGRQLVWLYGRHGEEGKSYVSSAIADGLFKSTAGATSNNMVKSANQFTTSQFLDKLFVVYGDCNNKRFLMTELAKTLSTSGKVDAASIEQKYKNATVGYLKTRMLICSNYLPEIADENSLESRLILVEIQPFKGNKDPYVKEKLIKELPQLLAYGKVCYEELCVEDYYFEMTDKTKQTIKDIQGGFFEDFNIIFNTYFELDPNGQITGAELQAAMKNEKMNQTLQNNFREYLQRQMGIEKVTQTNKSINYKGLKLKGKSNNVINLEAIR
jgi:hypothetical protein